MSSSADLAQLAEAQQLSRLDLNFTRLMLRLNGAASSELELAAALVSQATAAGNVCLPLESIADRSFAGYRVPGREQLALRLRASRVVGAPGDFRPLILDDSGRLYLQRYWQYEQQLAADLLARTESDEPAVDRAGLQRGLEQLFGQTTKSGTDWQRVAAAVAVLRRFTLISGGPGSGKTTTVMRILALLQQQSGQRLEIALAAPTGKAAVRLQESVRLAKQKLPLEPAALAAIPEQAQTLHRLLGMGSGVARARHHAGNPLHCDALVVDEASMVDLSLMARLLQALPITSRLILLGDRHQLASVEAGAVLGDICGDSTGFSTAFARQLQEITGASLPAAQSGMESPVADSVVLLRQSYRFASDSGIGRLAAAVNSGQAEMVLRELKDGRSGLHWMAAGDPLIPSILQNYREYLELAAQDADPESVFAAFNAYRVLTALNRGERGSARLNERVERALVSAGRVRNPEGWYAGRPVVVRVNDYNLGLYNGDIGLLLKDGRGQMRVCFAADRGYRWIAPSRLPRHELAYTMTVHMSQGSEFDRVLLVLPDKDVPLLTRELLYTAVTRARVRFEIAATEELLYPAIERRLHRSSGLRDALWSVVPA